MRARFPLARQKELADNEHLLRAWRKWHREQLQEAIAGPHGELLRELEAFIAALPPNPTALIEFVAAQDWRPLDADTRYLALRRINAAITALRESKGASAV
jgi:hypothetical protein